MYNNVLIVEKEAKVMVYTQPPKDNTTQRVNTTIVSK